MESYTFNLVYTSCQKTDLFEFFQLKMYINTDSNTFIFRDVRQINLEMEVF